MNEISCSLSSVDIRIRAGGVLVNYSELSHADFNILIALYKLLGFYKAIDLTLAPDTPEEQPTAAPQEIA